MENSTASTTRTTPWVNQTSTNTSVWISDMGKIKIEFHSLSSGSTVMNIVNGVSPIVTLFFASAEDAKTFATETWLAWTDYDFGVI